MSPRPRNSCSRPATASRISVFARFRRDACSSGGVASRTLPAGLRADLGDLRRRLRGDVGLPSDFDDADLARSTSGTGSRACSSWTIPNWTCPHHRTNRVSPPTVTRPLPLSRTVPAHRSWRQTGSTLEDRRRRGRRRCRAGHLRRSGPTRHSGPCRRGRPRCSPTRCRGRQLVGDAAEEHRFVERQRRGGERVARRPPRWWAQAPPALRRGRRRAPPRSHRRWRRRRWSAVESRSPRSRTADHPTRRRRPRRLNACSEASRWRSASASTASLPGGVRRGRFVAAVRASGSGEQSQGHDGPQPSRSHHRTHSPTLHRRTGQTVTGVRSP